ncbi:hypothetical protein AN643_00750 [Candidatus Epulonipiscioides saccharophilum]|nr:hypothetical protein AN643_00750 [Epulopiscium sp. SCG-B10WGA-EpuloB]
MKKRLTLGLMMTTLMLGITGCNNEDTTVSNTNIIKESSNNIEESSNTIEEFNKEEIANNIEELGQQNTVKEEIIKEDLELISEETVELINEELDQTEEADLLHAELEPAEEADSLHAELEPAEEVNLLHAELEPAEEADSLHAELEPAEEADLLHAELDRTQEADSLQKESEDKKLDELAEEKMEEAKENKETTLKEVQEAVKTAMEMEWAAKEKNAIDPENKIVIIHTNDIHCAIDSSMGYAGVKAFEEEMNEIYGEEDVILIDAGDIIQGGAIGKLTQGQATIDIMNEIGYDICTIGNHEFAYGIPRLLELMEDLDAEKISCNFIDLKTEEPVFKAYTMMEHGDKKIAYIGVTTPETITKATSEYFKDDNGEYIYDLRQGSNGLELYSSVQDTVNEAKENGADYIILISHLGIGKESKPWRSTDLIENTTNIDLVIDAHSHSMIYGETVYNKINKPVILTQVGSEFDGMGKIIIDTKTNKMIAGIITEYEKKDSDIEKLIKEINDEFAEELDTVIATNEYHLAVTHPESKLRIIRNQETNLGNLIADGYRAALKSDVAIMNSGGIRSDIKPGEITYKDIVDVHPFNNEAISIEVTGQIILDALEMGAKYLPHEGGGFLQVSGLTYTVDTRIPSNVELSEEGQFVRVNGEYRVRDIKINGEPLNLKEKYSLASHNYMLLSFGDGMVMFKDAPILKENGMLDNEVLINYIVNHLNGKISEAYKNVNGEGRITILEEGDINNTTTSSNIYKNLEENTNKESENNLDSTKVIETIDIAEDKIEESKEIKDEIIEKTENQSDIEKSSVIIFESISFVFVSIIILPIPSNLVPACVKITGLFALLYTVSP